MVSVAYGQGRILRVDVVDTRTRLSNVVNPRYLASPSNFPRGTSLFRTSSIAISFTAKARIIKNERTKCIIFGEALRIKLKKLNHNLPENIQKALK